MRDAVGGVFNITFIAIFLVIVSGYLAFSVSYNKAFKVKNKVISVLEQYQHVNDTSKGKIIDYMNSIGYNASDITSYSGDKNSNDGCSWICPTDLRGVCYKWHQDTDSGNAGLSKGYFSVRTAVDIDIPIFNKFLPFMNFFQTSGDTMTINVENNCNGA